jgi:transglutaminase-like putative cysteine protease
MERRSPRWFDWYGLIFLTLALGFSTGRLEITGWVENLNEVDTSLYLGFILGIAIGFSGFRRRTAIWMGLFYGVINVFWQIGRLMSSHVAWIDRLMITINRLGYSGYSLFNHRAVSDPILFLTLMLILFWVVGFFGGFEFLRSGKPWGALATAALCVLIIDQYPPQPPDRVFINGAFFLFGILFIGRTYFLLTRKEWELKGRKLDSDVNSRSVLMLISLITSIFLIGWNIPLFLGVMTPGSEMRQKWIEFWKPMNGPFTKAFASLQNYQAPEITGVFNNQLDLGNSVPVSEDVVFQTHVSDPLPKGLNYYWRVRSYDQYQNGIWSSSINQQRQMPSGITYPTPPWVGRTNKIIDFEIKKSMASMPASNYPLYINYPLLISSLSVASTNSPIDDWEDIVSLSPQEWLQAGDHYRTIAFIDMPDSTQLQNSVGDYPEIIKKIDLQLPPHFSSKISELALKLTAGLSTSYEKSTVITEYIRKTIVYATEIKSPPQGQDPVEWVLFDLKKGFCNYDASAEVLMLRSLGIPARLVVGYAQGVALPEGNGFKIREKDTHAWVEVYFRNFGWVEFEPTPIQPERLYLPDSVAPGVTQSPTKALEKSAKQEATETSVKRATAIPLILIKQNKLLQDNIINFLIAAAYVAVFGLVIWLYTKFIFPRISPIVLSTQQKFTAYFSIKLALIIFPIEWYINATNIERLFIEIRWMILLFGERVKKSQTPLEQAKMLIRFVPEGEYEMIMLLDAYQKSQFSWVEEGRENIFEAKTARNILWKRVISKRIRRWLNFRMRI